VSIGLTAPEALLVDVSAAMAGGDEARLEEAFRAALEGNVPGDAVEETLLQGYLFLGYPAALRALGLWRRVSGRPAPAGREEEGWDAWRLRGEAVCRQVYADQYERLRENVRALHPDLERWMVVEGYGKVLGRPGLELRLRELCILALLAVLDAPPQLHSHLRGALNVGAPPEAVEAALDRALALAPSEGARARATETWTEVRDRWNAVRRAGSR
jgi:4-carboxymuconolactone decarboxylase